MDRPKLSTAEIEALLPESSDAPAPDLEHAESDDSENPSDLGDDAVQALRNLLDSFAAELTVEVYEPLRGETDFQFRAMQEVSGQELLARMERPTCIFIVQLPTVAERVIVELPYQVFFPLLDRLLGGGKHPSPAMRRPLTRIERRLSMRLANYVMAALQRALPAHLAMEPKLLGVECDPRVMRLQPDARHLMTQFEVKVPVQTGSCYVSFDRSDVSQLERVLRLGPHAKIIERSPQVIPGKAPGQLTAVVGNALIDAALLQSSGLEEGQVIWTDSAPDDPVLVYEGGTLKYVADKVCSKGEKRFAC